MANNIVQASDYTKIEVSEVLKKMATDHRGLSSAAALERLARYGSNDISQAKELHIIWVFLSYFKNPLIIILLVAAVISFFMRDAVSAAIIAFMALSSVVLDFIEEHSANKAARKLKETVKNTACVIREGSQLEINTADIVPGDIIFLNAGDLIPADARIIHEDELFVDESALSGESFPCEKTDEAIPEGNSTANMVYLGTSVISGEATAVVVKTGLASEFGKIADSLVKPAEKSEFEMGIAKFGVFIARVVLYLVLFIFLINTIRNLGGGIGNFQAQIVQSFLFAVAIAVGVTPELLPMIMSVTMSRGSIRMSKKGVIVKKLSAIPSFGSMDILCTDKTGTLTENKIALVTYTDIDGKVDENVLAYAYTNSYFETGIENPLDKALLDFKTINTNGWKKIDELPFDFERRIMSIIVQGPSNRLLIAKGSPESIFKRCSFCRIDGKRAKFGTEANDKARQQYHCLSANGNRVLAVAVKKLKDKKTAYSKDDESALELLGFVSFYDPPKAGVKDVLWELHSIGIEVKIISGDNELVTQKICKEVGLNIKGVVLGNEVDRLSDQALQARASKTTIFARCSPIQKNRIIAALRSRGKVVGYMGDGINDAPSLKGADVGISVNNAVDVAKESADIVLTRKDLEVLKDGVMEGRKVFGNTMKYIMMGLSSNFGNMFSAAGAVIFLPFLPMLPIQILLNNFLYDFSQLTIPSDNVDGDWLRKPHHWNLKFIKKFMYFFGPVSSLFDFITFFVLFKMLSASAPLFWTGWFMESLATQILVIHVIRTRHTPFIKSRPGKYLLLSTIACVAVGWAVPYTALGRFFRFEALPLEFVAAITGIVVCYLLVAEILKRIFYRNYFKIL